MSEISWAHPAQRLLLWCWVACGLQLMQPAPLVFVVASMLVLVAWQGGRPALTGLRRSSRLMLSIVLIYGWSVPGRYVWPSWCSPTFEGLCAGGLQMLRLAGVILTLRLLLSGMVRERLLAGLYTLLAPLTLLGFDRSRAALRLSLTLAQVDALLATPMQPRSLWRALAQLESDAGVMPDVEWRPLAMTAAQRAVLGALTMGLLATLAAAWMTN
ncbi:hypothetical protein [Chitinolyticbacter albus]|uniref:hypothetical protein n=1 Tax=Chitinolyticbacter albus TaxID=2961951 RepID=UPI00210E008C|nr:hypothetical protein [Chitinolyticbacter albus]